MCLSPLHRYFFADGSSSVSFRTDHVRVQPIPCGRCVLCVKHQRDEWYRRCALERFSHKDACAITLTYSDEQLPSDGSWSPGDVRAFLKRLRRHLDYLGRPRIRFFIMPEYSPAPVYRPHYHGVLFSYWPEDAKRCSTSGRDLYGSAELERLWGHGFVSVQPFSAGTVRYAVGHATGKLSLREELPRHLRPLASLKSAGLGRGFFEDFESQLVSQDSVVIDGCKVGLPRYFDKRIAAKDESLLLELKAAREARALLSPELRDAARLEAKAEILLSRERSKKARRHH